MTADSRTDAELLQAHVDGDPDAFAVLFRRHRDRLWAVAMRTTNDREDAADGLQEAMLSAHRGAARFRGEAAVTTWLHRIVVNACVDRLRRRQAQPTVPLPGQDTDDEQERWHTGRHEPAAPTVDHDTRLVVRQALATLPYDQRAALILVDLQGHSVAEVAQLMGVAEGTIKSRCSRGRARLAVLLGHLRDADADQAPGDTGLNLGKTGNPSDSSHVRPEVTEPGDGSHPSGTATPAGGLK